jgi:hypothetical protein
MFSSEVSLSFIFATIGIILIFTAIGIVLVKQKANKLKGDV